ncbi:hypothetical protein STEG23_028190 [Scotinomys teguina]
MKFVESEKTKENQEAMVKEFEPLLNWMKGKSLKDKIERLWYLPMLLSGNMKRIMKTQAYQIGKDISTNYYASQKKTFEINPRHSMIRDMLQRIKEKEDDKTVLDLAVVLFETATLQCCRLLFEDTKVCGDRIERRLCLSLTIDPEAQAEDPEEEEPEDTAEDTEPDKEEEVDAGTEEQETAKESAAEKDEL